LPEPFERAAPLAEAQARIAARPSTPSPTVVVLDAEPRVRDLIAEILALDHYHGLPAADVDEALRICARDPGRVALVIADLAVCGVPCDAFTASLRGVVPSARVLYLVHGGAERAPSGSSTVTKPFTVDDLTEKVRQLLGRRTTTGSGGAGGSRGHPGGGRSPSG
jgi:DNA-binding response OmpR family regulator